MFEQTKTSLKPVHGLYELVAGPFRSSEYRALSIPQKVSLAGKNCYAAAKREIHGSQGAYVYPLLGVYRFFAIPGLRSLLFTSLFSGVAISVVVTVAMFILAWAPQFAVLSFIISPFLAFPTAIFLVLAESWYISFTIAKLTWMENVQEHVFDEVLMQEAKKDSSAVVLKEIITAVEKKPKKQAGFFAGKLIGRVRNYPRAVVEDLVEYVVTLPLNFLPGVGNALFVYVNAETLAMKYHARYFELKGWKTDQAQIRAFVEQREPAYRSFGIVAMLLNIIPVVNVVFALTNTAGAALWAADIEKRKSARAAATKAS